MNTMDVFVVIRDMGYDGESVSGIYQRKEDAEYIRDHLEAIDRDRLRDTFIRSKWNGSFEDFLRYYCHDTFRVDEEEVYLA